MTILKTIKVRWFFVGCFMLASSASALSFNNAYADGSYDRKVTQVEDKVNKVVVRAKFKRIYVISKCMISTGKSEDKYGDWFEVGDKAGAEMKKVFSAPKGDVICTSTKSKSSKISKASWKARHELFEIKTWKAGATEPTDTGHPTFNCRMKNGTAKQPFCYEVVDGGGSDIVGVSACINLKDKKNTTAYSLVTVLGEVPDGIADQVESYETALQKKPCSDRNY